MSEDKHHILPLKVYLSVAGALLALTALTIFLAGFHFGTFNLFVALLIAVIKSTIVALYFMHLRYDNKLYLTLLVMSIVFLIIFIGITMLDTMFRGAIDPLRNERINKEAVIYRNE